MLLPLVLGAAFVVALGMAALERLPLDRAVMGGVDSGNTSPSEEEPLPKHHRRKSGMFAIGALLVVVAAGILVAVVGLILEAYQ